MTVPLPVTEIVEAEGHLIDSQLMNAMFDTVVRHDAAFDVLEFRIGRTNDEPSFVSMRVTSKTPAALTERPRGTGVARVPRRQRRGRAPRAGRSRRLRAGGLLLDNQSSDVRAHRRRVGAGRSPAHGRGDRDRGGPRRAAGSCARSAPATRSSAASTGSRSCRSSRRAIGSASRS